MYIIMTTVHLLWSTPGAHWNVTKGKTLPRSCSASSELEKIERKGWGSETVREGRKDSHEDDDNKNSINTVFINMLDSVLYSFDDI
jgi:hypothetical protein